MKLKIGVFGFKDHNFIILRKTLHDICEIYLFNDIQNINFDFFIYYLSPEETYSNLIKKSFEVSKFISESNNTKLLLVTHQMNYKYISHFDNSNLDKLVLVEKYIRNICKISCIRTPKIINSYPSKLIQETTICYGILGLNYDIQFIQMLSLSNKIKTIIQKPILKNNYIIHGCYCTTKDLYYEINKLVYVQEPIMYIPSFIIYLYERYIKSTFLLSWKSMDEFRGKCHYKLSKYISIWLADITTETRLLTYGNKVETGIQESLEMFNS